MYTIRFANSKIEEYLRNTETKIESNKANKREILLYKKIAKTLYLISENPKHPGLNSHEIDELSRKYNIKIFESYIENRKSAAMRIFWVYGPNNNEITIFGLEQHPNNKNNSYKNINFSNIFNRNK